MRRRLSVPLAATMQALLFYAAHGVAYDHDDDMRLVRYSGLVPRGMAAVEQPFEPRYRAGAEMLRLISRVSFRLVCGPHDGQDSHVAKARANRMKPFFLSPFRHGQPLMFFFRSVGIICL